MMNNAFFMVCFVYQGLAKIPFGILITTMPFELEGFLMGFLGRKVSFSKISHLKQFFGKKRANLSVSMN